MNKREVGASYEKKAEDFLNRNGVIVTERNFRTHFGEIDLIGKDGEYLVFFEVKYRKTKLCGTPAQAVTSNKQRVICRVADFYRMKKRIGDFEPMRFDVISIHNEKITWYKNAYDYR